MNLQNNIDKVLRDLGACTQAREWAKGKTWEEIHTTCHRGDWLLWLFKKTMVDDEVNLRVLTLAKAHSANTVRHLMKDVRSTDAIDIAIQFGLGNLTLKELYEARTAADAAYADAAAYAAYAAAATDAYAADAAAAAAIANTYAARTKNQLETAGVCRKYLPIEIWNINN